MSLKVVLEEKIFKKNGSCIQILGNIEFEIGSGKIVCIYGPSGCGKSTLLRIIAGLDQDYEGKVLIDGEPVGQPTRRIGFVVQNDMSFQWLTVEKNITFGLKYLSNGRHTKDNFTKQLFSGNTIAASRKEAERLAEIVGLSIDDLDKFPEEISGGMKQRMAFARALLPKPDVLILDEPFSALDFESRHALQNAVLKARDELGISFICISHDPEEVLYLADEVLIMKGRPSKIVHQFKPKLPDHGRSDTLYTLEFQNTKKELRDWLRS